MRNATSSKRVEFIFKPIDVPHSRIFFVGLFSCFVVRGTGEMHLSSSIFIVCSDSFLLLRENNSAVRAANFVSAPTTCVTSQVNNTIKLRDKLTRHQRKSQINICSMDYYAESGQIHALSNDRWT